MLRYLALLLLLAATPAAAQDSNFPTPGNARVPGYVTMCLNGSNQAIPCAAGGGLAAGAAVTGCAAQSSLFITSTLTLGCVAAVSEADSGDPVTLTGHLVIPNGAAGTPSIALGGTGSTTGIFGSNTTFIIANSGVASVTVTAAAMLLAQNALNLPTGNSIGWNADTFLSRSAANTLRIGATSGTATGSLALTNLTASGTLAGTLTTAIGANVVCNAGTASSLLTLQVSATGCAASSARFKEGIASIDRAKALDDVLKFDAVSYRYRPEFDMGSDKHVGFTAEQVGSIDPQWITYERDGVTPHAVKYNEMVPLLTAAIQALKADNDNLKAEINNLKRVVGAR